MRNLLNLPIRSVNLIINNIVSHDTYTFIYNISNRLESNYNFLEVSLYLVEYKNLYSLLDSIKEILLFRNTSIKVCLLCKITDDDINNISKLLRDQDSISSISDNYSITNLVLNYNEELSSQLVNFESKVIDIESSRVLTNLTNSGIDTELILDSLDITHLGFLISAVEYLYEEFNNSDSDYVQVFGSANISLYIDSNSKIYSNYFRKDLSNCINNLVELVIVFMKENKLSILLDKLFINGGKVIEKYKELSVSDK